MEEGRMSIKLSDYTINKLYNKENKFNYLKDSKLKDSTKEKYPSKFLLVTETEKALGKDLYNFDEKDLLNCFKVMADNHSRTSLRSLFSICKLYVEWAINTSLKKNDVNPFVNIKFEEVWEIIKKTNIEKQYFSEEEIWKIKTKSINEQDTICIIPAFYGIKGHNSYELINLKDEDIDEVNNTIKLVDDSGLTRKLKIPQELIKLFKEAREQTIYNRRGEAGYGGKITAKLVENSTYIIRPTKVSGEKYITTQSIAIRCKKLLKDVEHEDISLNDIYMSGKLDLLKHIQQKKGKKLEIDDYKEVQFRFGDNINNYENIRELYESTISDEKLNVFSKKSLWNEISSLDEFYLSDMNEYNMNNSYKESLYEGDTNNSKVKRYARSRMARNLCIKKWGVKCIICDFDFKKTYGEVGKDLIHVHHLSPISKVGKNHKVDPIEDLRPVCPNCHLIIHKDKNELCSIAEVKNMIRNNKSKVDI
jgi:predicted HNH restriction endonuclease/integrase